MMKYLIFFSFIFLNLSCGKKDTTSQISVRPQQIKNDFYFKHKRVQELFIVIFEKNYLPEEWKDIFNLTNILSANKKALRLIEGLDTEDAGNTRSNLIKKNAEILSTLSEKSVFMLSWSAEDENCKIIQKDQWIFSCKPRNTNNPLNGGLPVVTQPLEWLIPDPVRSEIKTPYLKVLMKKELTAENAAAYALELRLKEESVSDHESWFKGDVIPSADSRFLKSDGSLTNSFFSFGYAELTLGN